MNAVILAAGLGGGTGLGLAIVSTAISQHNGKVTANDSPLGGLRLEIWLPLHPR